MKTFLPIAGQSFKDGVLQSLLCLDNQRLGKQRVEALQIWLTLRDIPPLDRPNSRKEHGGASPERRPAVRKIRPWTRHPCYSQWFGHTDALALYLVHSCEIWGSRVSRKTGKPFANSLMSENIERFFIDHHDAMADNHKITFATVTMPWWWGDKRIHESDAAALYRKDPVHYAQFAEFSDSYPEYVWPNKIRHEYFPEEAEAEAVAAKVAAGEAARSSKTGRRRKS